MVARYRGEEKDRLFRGDAAFGLPELYEYLEAEGSPYEIRLPANTVLQERIAPLLGRPVGRPPKLVRRLYASFQYKAQTWDREGRVVAKVEGPGELYPRVAFIVTKPQATARSRRRVRQRPRHGRAVDQGREERGQVDAAFVHDVPGGCRAAPAPCASLQPRKPPAHAGAAGRGGAMVAHQRA